MSTLALFTTNGIALAVGAAVMYLPAVRKLADARLIEAHADRTFDAAEQLADEVERTRNLPWHYAAIEAAPELEPAEHEGEVLHVEHATAELRQLIAQLDATDDDAMDALPAISDRPADDEDIVGEEQPGEAQSRLLAKLHAFLRWLDDLTDRAHDWLDDRLKSNARRDAEFRQLADDDVETDDEFERAVMEAEVQAWRGVPTEPAPELEAAAEVPTDVGRHGSDRVAEDTGYRGSRWAAGIEHTGLHPIVVPAQRACCGEHVSDGCAPDEGTHQFDDYPRPCCDRCPNADGGVA